MESAYSTARDCNEQNREQISFTCNIETCIRCELYCRVFYEYTDEGSRHHSIQQERAQIVAGLEKQPDRKNRSKGNVYDKNDVPCPCGEFKNREVVTDHDCSGYEDYAENR